MYNVNVILKNSPCAVTFTFKAFKRADDLYRKLINALEDMEAVAFAESDDYGLIAIIIIAEISAVTFIEYQKDMDKAGEMQIIQAKSNIRTQNLAKNDVQLRFAASNNTLQ